MDTGFSAQELEQSGSYGSDLHRIGPCLAGNWAFDMAKFSLALLSFGYLVYGQWSAEG